ncbi:LysM peptidoglycan-binding domain-containing protein [Brevibacillus laterosporus]|uniref:LysM peptidoglycan-binding domain-containing protein n=2 Tax=Brevibacillus laterosporus TaxID=1465 RepID=UPI001F5598E1|nr:LysM peptidoglycan-binding domain-containing protein [Brevibacillus laterosporus]
MTLRDVMMSLSYNNEEKIIYFPVLPESIEISDGSNSKTYTTVGLGEINVIKDPKLSGYKFSSEFPNQAYPHVSRPANLKPPKEYVKLIQEWLKTKRPLRFIYTGQSFDINEAVSIESFDWKETAGMGGDIEFSMTLKKYKFYAAKKADILKIKDASGKEKTVVQKKPAPRPTDKQPPKTHKIAKGDSLWVISKKAYGKGDRWKEIQKLNGLTDAQAKKLKVGTTLKLPS